MKDLYKSLGATDTCTEQELRDAYKRSVKINHPDAGGDAEQFHKVQHAYMVLRDPKRREEYDKTGQDPGAEVDNEQAVILTVISQMLEQFVMAGEQVIYSDLIFQMTAKIRNDALEHEKLVANNNRSKVQIERLMKRFKKKSKASPDLIMLAFTGQLNLIANNERVLAEAKKQRDAVLLALSDYEFAVEPQQRSAYVPSQYAAHNASFAGFFQAGT